MPRLYPVSGDEVIRALERLGFRRDRQRGSHITLSKQTPDGTINCVVPLHSSIKIGTLRSILRQAKITPEEFIKNL